MATKKKLLTESPEEIEVNDDKENETLTEIQEDQTKDEYVSIPDIPAQLDVSVPEEPKGETEVQFLQRILNKQHQGGFGRHLDDMINDRIKSLK